MSARLPWVLRVLGGLPLGLARAFGVGLGWLVWLASPRYRRMTRANLETAGLERSLLPDVIAETGRMVAELPFVWASPSRRLLDRIDGDEARARLARWRAENRIAGGVIFMTPHLGGFEASSRFLASIAPITVMFKPPKLAWLARWLVAARAHDAGVRAVPASLSGVRSMARALRAGEAVGVLPDQVPTAGDGDGCHSSARMRTMSLPMRLHQMTGAPLVIVLCQRQAGRPAWRIELEIFDGEPTPKRSMPPSRP
ncbi:MAG: lysophospholipid acyltransferase family protein [Burkholderiaceae bacterium]